MQQRQRKWRCSKPARSLASHFHCTADTWLWLWLCLLCVHRISTCNNEDQSRSMQHRRWLSDHHSTSSAMWRDSASERSFCDPTRGIVGPDHRRDSGTLDSCDGASRGGDFCQHFFPAPSRMPGFRRYSGHCTWSLHKRPICEAASEQRLCMRSGLDACSSRRREAVAKNRTGPMHDMDPL